MLKLLLKYEMKEMSKKIFPYYLILSLIGIAITTVFFSINFHKYFSDSICDFIRTAFIILLAAIILAVNIATLIFTAKRLYTNILGEQGYLMNTIPVTVDQNLLCKLISCYIWNLITEIISLIVVISIVMACNNYNLSDLVIIVNDKISYAYSILNMDFIQYIIEFLLIMLFSIILGILLVFVSICIGHLFKRKIISAIIVYLIIYFTECIVINFIDNLFLQTKNIDFNKISDIQSLANNSIVHLELWVMIISFLIISSIFYCICRYILRNKINLN